MSSSFEHALRARSEADPDVAPLSAQWEFDRRLITNALAGVALTFPHFSRHDASHSSAILLQLARIMGAERIRALSATDLWLLLEAAYHHDLGMVLTDEEARRLWSSPEFEAFLEQAQFGPDLDLRGAAELVRGTRSDRTPSTWPLDTRRATVLLLAEFVRRQHAQRARQFAHAPDLIGLRSPRTELLPQRLFGVLGDICRSHGQSFEETMALPRSASGMGTDTAHPRFVACMLRLGDLLDLDNGRFCPVMQRVGGILPAMSLAHVEKHAAIRHLLVSPTLIEVDAECETYPGYEVTWQWLDWLQQELQKQMLAWSTIAPASFGALPSLGRIEVRQHNYIALQPGQRPRFEVDREGTLKLLQGANLYPHREDAIRELIQNAVDATLIRLWADKWSHLTTNEVESRTPRDLRAAMAAWPIDITFERLNDGTQWRISIQDQGTGIAFEDLRYLLTVGSSRKNPTRSEAIRRMPDWMRPSGIFGIGLQSAFLLTDELVLSTRHHDAGQAHEITLRTSDSGGADGLLLKMLDGDERKRLMVGTKVSFVIKTERIPLISSSDNEFPEAHKLLSEFDPIIMDEMPYAIARIRDLVRKLAQESLCVLQIAGQRPISGPEESIYEFDRLSGCELACHFEFRGIAFRALQGGDDSSFYRGSPIKTSFHRPLARIFCNIHTGRADELLTLNREGLTHSGRADVYRRITEALSRLMPKWLNRLRHFDPKQAQIASLMAHLMRLPECGNEWRQVRIQGKESNDTFITLDELLKLPRVTRNRNNLYNARHDFMFYNKSKSDIVILDSTSWLSNLLSLHGFHLTYDGWEGNTFSRSSFNRTNIYIHDKSVERDIVTDKGLLQILLGDQHNSTFRRSTIPCQRDYISLRITDDQLAGFEHYKMNLKPRMVNPFLVSWHPNEMAHVSIPHPGPLIRWISAHKVDPATSMSSIASTLLAFIRKVDNLLVGEIPVRKDYDMAALELELGRFIERA